MPTFDIEQQPTMLNKSLLPVNRNKSQVIIGFLCGAIYGGMAVFGVAGAGHGESGFFYQGTGLVLTVSLISIFYIRWFGSWLRYRVGVCFAIHSAVAGISALINDCSLASTARYILLLPTISLMLATVELGSKAISGMRAGLTVTGFVSVCYCLLRVDMSQLASASYRGGDSPYNPNALGYYAAVCGVSILCYAYAYMQSPTFSRKILGPLFMIGVAACAVSLLSTKSRTASAAFVAGVLTATYLFLGTRKTIILSIVLLLASVTVIASTVSSTGEWIAQVFQFSDRYRGLEGGTGRFEGWYFIITELWPAYPLLGTGPGRHVEIGVMMHGIFQGAHNGILLNLAETGLLGTIPLVVVLAFCFKSVFRNIQCPAMHFAIAIFVTGVVESLAEFTLFSIGNPSGLLFMLSVALLSQTKSEEAISSSSSTLPSLASSPSID